LLAVAGTAAGLLVFAAPDALAGTGDTPVRGDITVTFTPTPGEDCSSRPDVDSIAMRPATWINVVNSTGHDAILATGAPRAVGFPADFPLASGKSLKFKDGRYLLQMVPTCPSGGLGDVLATIVDVSDSAPDPPLVIPGSGTPVGGGGGNSGGGSPGGDHPGHTPTDGPGGPPGIVGGDPILGVYDTPYPTPGATGTGATANGSGQGGGEAVQAGGAQTVGDDLTDSIEVRPYTTPAALAAAESARRNRLLAIIASICVLGVTTAVIRAIISERVTRTSGR
jgi:hypothetical protein